MTDEFLERITNIIADAVMIRGSQSTRYSYAIQRGMKEALEVVEELIRSTHSGNSHSLNNLLVLKQTISAWKEKLI